MAKYDSDSIDVLAGLEGVRRKPSLYIGGLKSHGVFQLLKEAFDNCVDEYFTGRNKFAQVVIGPERNSFIVHDESSGIPIGMKSIKTAEGGVEKISAFTAIFTRLHAGGKFGSHAYKISAGTHGIGIKTITALSTQLDAWTFRDGVWYHQSFGKGEILTKLKKARPPRSITSELLKRPTKGTILSWTVDESILGKGAKLKVADFIDYVSSLSYLNEGLKILVKDHQQEEYEFFNKRGPIEFLEAVIEEEELEAVGKPMILQLENCKLAVQLTSYDESDGLESYVNASYTANGGQHTNGFWAAYGRALKDFSINKHKYTPRDLRYGIAGFFNWMMSEPNFSSQTKEELSSPVKKEVEELLYEEMYEWFSKNKSTARSMLDRATAIHTARAQTKELMSAVSGMKTVKGKKGILLPKVLQQATNAKPEDKELFIVEGLSAAGGCKYGRYKEYQEILALKGKPINAAKATLTKTLNSEPVQHILTAIGFDPKNPDANLRVGKVMILADADADGHHITLLILTLLWIIMPRLFKEDRVFVVDGPLFMSKHRDQAYFGDSIEEVQQQLPRSVKPTITRLKGWGECSRPDLRLIAFNPDSRKLFKIDPVKGVSLTKFMKVVGDDPVLRKQILGVVQK